MQYGDKGTKLAFQKNKKKDEEIKTFLAISLSYCFIQAYHNCNIIDVLCQVVLKAPLLFMTTEEVGKCPSVMQ